MKNSYGKKAMRESMVNRTLTCAIGFMAFLLCVIAESPFAQCQEEAYTLGPKDVIQISVLGVEELDREITIPSQGSFTFPPIGLVNATGKTATEVQEDIRKRLADGYVKSPTVVVVVKETASRNILVIGAVQKPGPVPTHSKLSMLEIIAQANGLTENSSKQATIIRKTNPDEPIKVNLKGLMDGRMDENVVAHEGDIVIFPSIGEASERVNVLGAVRDPGSYPYVKDMSLVDLLTAAGGPSPSAGTTVIVLSAKAAAEGGATSEGKTDTAAVKPITFNLTNVLTGQEGAEIRLNNRDTIIVPSTDDFRTSFFITGEVRNPGMYPHRDGMTVLHAIVVAGGVTESGSVGGITVVENGGVGRIKPKKVDLSYQIRQGDMILVPRGWF